MSDLKLSILLQAIDRMSGPMRRAAGSVQRATNAMSEAGKKAAKSMEGVSNASKKMTQVGQSMALKVSAPIVGFGILSLRASANFEQAMNKVGVLTKATGEDMKSLQDLAREMGKTTQFSASQAAEAMGFLAQAGFDTEKIIGSLPGVMQLAAAGNMDLGRAADVVTNIMSGYGIEANKLAEVNDVLVTAFTSANTDLGQLAEAMKIAGPVAKGMNQTFEVTSAVLGTMGDSGYQASLGGTALRATLSRLSNPAKDAQRALGRLGIKKSDIMDSTGQLRSLVDIIRVLEKSGGEATEWMQVFGERAGPAMTAVINTGADHIERFSKQLENAGGTAKRVADAQMKGATGEMRKFVSAFEGLQLAIGDSGLLQWFTDFARSATEWMSSLSESSKTALKWGTIIAALAAAIAPVLIAIGSLGMAISGITVAVAALSAVSLPIVAIIAAIAALVAVVALIYTYWEPISAFFSDLWDGILGKFTSAIEAIRSGLSGITDMVPDGVKSFFGFDSGGPPPAAASAFPNGPGGTSRTQVGGELKVTIDSEGRPRVRDLKSINPDVGIAVDTGLAMAGG